MMCPLHLFACSLFFLFSFSFFQKHDHQFLDFTIIMFLISYRRPCQRIALIASFFIWSPQITRFGLLAQEHVQTCEQLPICFKNNCPMGCPGNHQLRGQTVAISRNFTHVQAMFWLLLYKQVGLLACTDQNRIDPPPIHVTAPILYEQFFRKDAWRSLMPLPVEIYCQTKHKTTKIRNTACLLA